MRAIHLLVLALSLAPLPAAAAEATYDISFRGLPAGVLAMNARESGGRYAATVKIVGQIARFSYVGRSEGRRRGGRYTPDRYEESADTGRRQSRAVMAYRAGVPQLKRYEPPRPAEPGDLDPADQGGTVDPLTAIYATLRDLPRSEVCTLALATFDGRRRGAVQLADPVEDGDTIRCSGTYRRVAGFAPREMRRRTAFPFTLTYAPLADGRWRVTRIVFRTSYGPAEMNRR